MKISTRLVLTTLAVAMLLVGTFSVVFAAPQCGYMPQLMTICNYNGCGPNGLDLTFCSGNSTTCPDSYFSTNVSGPYACTYTGSKIDACVPALGGLNGQQSLTTTCMTYEECEYVMGAMSCLPTGNYDFPCMAPYYKRVNC